MDETRDALDKYRHSGSTLPMPDCPHRNLLMLTAPTGEMLRCRHCHLIIHSVELDRGHCPECLEEMGEQRADFDSVQPEPPATVRYRCEDCGALVEVGKP